jgi:acyl carrier protein
VCKYFDNLHDLKQLRFVCVGSEPYSKEDLELFQAKLPRQVTMQIAYATTETRTISERKIRLNELTSSPNYSVGKVVENRRVVLLGDEGQQVKTGEIGEIVVIAREIPDCYLNDRAATKKAFSKHADGMIHYATGDLGYFDELDQLYWYGRKDFVVKINGQKVNLLETEALLNSAPSVAEAAVIVDANQRMLAFFTVGDGFERDQFLDEISSKIPAQLLPNQWIQLEAMPKTHTGKINRKQLHALSESTTETKEETEVDIQGDSLTIIKQIWKQELSLRHEINDGDDFFTDLGGDSLTCEVCLAEVEKQLRIKLPEGAAFTYTTPRSLVDFIDVYEKETVICIPLTTYDSGKPDFYFVPPYPADRRMYHRFEESFSGKYNLFFLYYNPVGIQRELVPLPILLKKMADAVTAPERSTILGFSFGGILAYLVSLELQNRNRAASRLILLDTPMYQPFNRYERGWNFVKRLGRKGMLFVTSPSVLLRYVRDFGGAYKEYKENFISEKQKDDAFHPAQIIWHYIQSFPDFRGINSKIVLFQSENPSVFQYQIRPDFRWKRYAKGGFDRFILKGAHYEVLTEEENIELMIGRILELN